MPLHVVFPCFYFMKLFVFCNISAIKTQKVIPEKNKIVSNTCEFVFEI